jgi:hypothetical protein
MWAAWMTGWRRWVGSMAERGHGTQGVCQRSHCPADFGQRLAASGEQTAVDAAGIDPVSYMLSNVIVAPEHKTS